MRFYRIPVFIPEAACPHQCAFCNQKKITGSSCIPSPQDIDIQIAHWLTTMPRENRVVELAFFGGSFTGIPFDEQQRYLGVASKWLSSNAIQSIRVSTRPDYINREVLDLLAHYKVSNIELGAQSLDDEVLIMSERGHTAANVDDAAGQILQRGFTLGLQMMTGLPGDTPLKSLYTAKKIIALGATETRIYPTLVVKGTQLESLYFANKYKPQSLSEAIDLCATLFDVFTEKEVKILRMGLHPSEGFLNGTDLIAGPFHPAFGELVKTEVWHRKIQAAFTKNPIGKAILYVAPAEVNAAIGHRKSNKQWLAETYGNIQIKIDANLTGMQYYVDYS